MSPNRASASGNQGINIASIGEGHSSTFGTLRSGDNDANGLLDES